MSGTARCAGSGYFLAKGVTFGSQPFPVPLGSLAVFVCRDASPLDTSTCDEKPIGSWFSRQLSSFRCGETAYFIGTGNAGVNPALPNTTGGRLATQDAGKRSLLAWFSERFRFALLRRLSLLLRGLVQIQTRLFGSRDGVGYAANEDRLVLNAIYSG